MKNPVRPLAALLCSLSLSLAALAEPAPDKAGAKKVPADLPLEVTPAAPAAPPPAPAAATAALANPDHFAVVSGETDAVGHDVLTAEFGFPGISAGYNHALSDRSDWGARFDLNYSLYNTTNTQFGLGFRVPLRMVLARQEKVSVLLHVDPGLYLYTGGSNSNSHYGLSVTPGASVGFQVLPELRLALTADLPVWIEVAHGGDLILGPQFGFGAEYFIDKRLSVGMALRFGPIFVPTASGGAQFGFTSLFSLGYRL